VRDIEAPDGLLVMAPEPVLVDELAQLAIDNAATAVATVVRKDNWDTEDSG
jgi:hypothetical protein